MFRWLSKMISGQSDQSKNHNEELPVGTGLNFDDHEDLLIVVLSFVSAHDLIRNCRLVSQLWKETIDSNSLWKIKCDRERVCLPTTRLDVIPRNYYRHIYFQGKYGTNLIKNPHGIDSLNNWVLTANNGDGFRVEQPPQGADPVPAEAGGIQSCFATSFGPCIKSQSVDLYENATCKYLLESGIAKIKIGSWYAHRFDCASLYRLHVILQNSKRSEIDHFTFQHHEEQWLGKKWDQVTHTFQNVKNARYVFFEEGGNDEQFWAGHYGSKMTGAYINLCFK
ncbi:F-box only protein 6-like [Uloborus diversus]|uniref:F-box only protein 6-like n=1 Tax=Uloborus diversus TaxID=327109 RepID=UPI0024095FA7|nr:F-box only protein 6-like [Uloborus diversus]